MEVRADTQQQVQITNVIGLGACLASDTNHWRWDGHLRTPQGFEQVTDKTKAPKQKNGENTNEKPIEISVSGPDKLVMSSGQQPGDRFPVQLSEKPIYTINLPESVDEDAEIIYQTLEINKTTGRVLPFPISIIFQFANSKIQPLTGRRIGKNKELLDHMQFLQHGEKLKIQGKTITKTAHISAASLTPPGTYAVNITFVVKLKSGTYMGNKDVEVVYDEKKSADPKETEKIVKTLHDLIGHEIKHLQDLTGEEGKNAHMTLRWWDEKQLAFMEETLGLITTIPKHYLDELEKIKEFKEAVTMITAAKNDMNNKKATDIKAIYAKYDVWDLMHALTLASHTMQHYIEVEQP